LRTARVTAECWRGLPARGAPRGMLPAGVDGARSTPTRAHDLHPSDPPPSRRCISGAQLSCHPPSRPAVARISNNSITDSSTAQPPLQRNEKTEKSSLSFARRSVSDGNHQGWQGWYSSGYYGRLTGRLNVFTSIKLRLFGAMR